MVQFYPVISVTTVKNQNIVITIYHTIYYIQHYTNDVKII